MNLSVVLNKPVPPTQLQNLSNTIHAITNNWYGFMGKDFVLNDIMSFELTDCNKKVSKKAINDIEIVVKTFFLALEIEITKMKWRIIYETN